MSLPILIGLFVIAVELVLIHSCWQWLKANQVMPLSPIPDYRAWLPTQSTPLSFPQVYASSAVAFVDTFATTASYAPGRRRRA